jgi:hypothetical protein
MAFTKEVTNAVAVSGVFTLTLSDVDNLYKGDTVFLNGISTGGFSGSHVLTGVNVTNKTVTYAHGNTTSNLGAVQGQLEARPQWVEASDVLEWLGIDVATANDNAYVETCVLASNEWCFRKRQEAGYLSDRTAFFPSADVHLGAVNYAAMQYRNRGAIDGFASFDSFGGGTPTMSLGQIMALLGVGKAQVG